MFALLLAAAAPDPMLELLALDVRVATVGDRLARAGGCDGVLSTPGWIVQDIAQYAPKLREAARAGLGLGDAPTIVALLPNGAATRAGLRAGDEIVAIGGVEVAKSSNAYRRMSVLDDGVEQGLRAGRVTVRVRRADAAWEVTLPAESGCPSRFQLLTGKGLNAEADGRYVQVSSALAEFAASDDELALVLAHELAHNILGHRVKLKGRQVRTRDAELEADAKALELMAAAGYDPAVAPGFWRRLGGRGLPDWLRNGSHPSTKERVARAEAYLARR